VGNPLHARFPTPDPSTRLAEFPDRSLEDLPRGPFPQRIIEETEEDLEAFIAVLTGLGVTVRRPETWPHEARFSTIHWEAQGYYNYCPRDLLLVVADQIIETPNVIRSRSQETFSYRALMVDYLRSGARWYAAPRPMLLDSLFEVDRSRPTPRNDEPAFDAANVLRLGRDLVYLVSSTGNELGGQWLQTLLGETYRVHFLEDVYFGSHIDSTFVALRPGLVLCNSARVADETLQGILKQWEVLYAIGDRATCACGSRARRTSRPRRSNRRARCSRRRSAPGRTGSVPRTIAATTRWRTTCCAAASRRTVRWSPRPGDSSADPRASRSWPASRAGSSASPARGTWWRARSPTARSVSTSRTSGRESLTGWPLEAMISFPFAKT